MDVPCMIPDMENSIPSLFVDILLIKAVFLQILQGTQCLFTSNSIYIHL